VIGVKISRFAIVNDLENRSGIKLTSQSTDLLLTIHRSFRNFLLHVLVCLIFSPCINPQQEELPFEHYSIEQGMPTFVTSILQDRNGFMWFNSWDGLYRYDGYNFISYKHDPDDSTSIDNTYGSTLYEDRAGILWLGTRRGLEKFDPIKKSFTHYTPNPLVTANDKSNNVWTICEDKDGLLWVGTGDGLYKFDKALGKFTCMRYDSTDSGSVSHNFILSSYKDNDGMLWFGTAAGLDRFDFETGKFVHYWNIPDRKRIWENNSKYCVNTIFGDDTGILWLGTNGGLVEFNIEKGSSYIYPFSKYPINHTTTICKDVNTNDLWVGTWDGLFIFNKKLKKYTPYYSRTFGPQAVSCLFSERSGTLWVGTNTGVKKLNRIKQPFQKYYVGHEALAIVAEKEGILWIYTYVGWKKFDINKEQVVPYSFGKDSLIFIYNSGDLAFYTEKGELYIKDTLGKVIPLLNSSYKEFIKSLTWGHKTNKGYWLSDEFGGLHFFDPKTNSFREIKNFIEGIHYFYEDTSGLLWIGTFMGKLLCYNPEQDSVIEFICDIKNPSSISGRQINQIHEDRKGRLWIATNTGLNRFVRATNRFVHFTEKNGLKSNFIRGILEDDHGYLWLNTGKSISKFDPETNHFQNYDVSYGLEQPANLMYGLGCKTKNGEMFFGGSNGFTRFHPDSVKDNSFIPPIEITSFKKFDKPSTFSNEIHLPYDENFISFEFVALSYISPERNQYAYMMEGLDKDWVYSGTRRYASYPNLDPGEYIFRVKGSNNDGVWNEAGASISIIISPPWWKTIWAYIFYSIVILSIIYFTWKMQVKRIRMSHEYEMTKFEAEKLHEVDELKSRFFANISHEFRTPLTLILGPVKQIIERTKEDRTRDDLKVVRKNANRLLGLVNQLLDISKLESGNMKLQTSPQNIIPLLKALLQSFCSYAERKRITIKFNSSEDEIIAYIDKDKIEKIITNVLSNAFKFTPEGGKIDVTVKPTPRPSKGGDEALLKVPSSGGDLGVGLRSVPIKGFVEIAIHDTGIGIPKEKLPKIFDRFYQVDGSHTREQEGTGIGLSLTKELVELHRGKIEVKSEEGKGTTFTILLPLGKEYLKPEEICEPEKEKEKVPFIPEEMIYQEEMQTEQADIGLITETGRPLLLIVEDNSDVRNYIKENLNKDYRILEGVDGEDGWNKALEHIPDLIVSDVMMPKMDGFKLCEKIKTDERTSHIPVILLTAKAASSDKIEGLEIGADDYIMKPFETDELRARIKNLIEQRKRIHEHFKKHGLFEIEEKNITPVDQKFLQKVFDLITRHVSNSSLNVESLTEDLALSRSVLHRKILSLVGETPGELIRRIRLKKAASLIEKNFGNLSEVALEVGFNNPAYFSEAFKKQFGMSPSQYQQKCAGN